MQVKSGSQLPLNLSVDSENRFQNFFEFGIEPSEVVSLTEAKILLLLI